MSKVCGIIGPPATGKTQSAFNTYYEPFDLKILGLDPKETFYFNPIGKELPADNLYREVIFTENGGIVGNKYTNYDPVEILRVMQFINTIPYIKNIIVDDFQQIMSNDFFYRRNEIGYEKFAQIGFNAGAILQYINFMRPDIFVVIMSHTEEYVENEQRRVKFKTIGKMLDEKMTPEGLFTMLLYAQCTWDEIENKPTYSFRTTKRFQYDPTRSFLGMFKHEDGKHLYEIPNDLGYIKDSMRKYYTKQAEPASVN